MAFNYYDDDPMIEVKGPDIPAMQPMMGQPKTIAPPPAAMPNGFPANHQMEVIQGGQSRFFDFKNGQIDPQQYREDVQRTQQALGVNDGMDGGLPIASGPHSDKFDYEYSQLQQQRMLALQNQKQRVWSANNVHPWQKARATAMIDNELKFIMENPIAKPKNKPPKMPNGLHVGEITTIDGRKWQNNKDGVLEPMDKEDSPSALARLAVEIQKAGGVDESGAAKKSLQEAAREAKIIVTEWKKGTPAEDAPPEQVPAEETPWKALFSEQRQLDEELQKGVKGPRLQEIQQRKGQINKEIDQQEYDGIKKTYGKLSKAPQKVQQRFWELHSRLGK